MEPRASSQLLLEQTLQLSDHPATSNLRRSERSGSGEAAERQRRGRVGRRALAPPRPSGARAPAGGGTPAASPTAGRPRADRPSAQAANAPFLAYARNRPPTNPRQTAQSRKRGRLGRAGARSCVVARGRAGRLGGAFLSYIARPRCHQRKPGRLLVTKRALGCPLMRQWAVAVGLFWWA